MGQRQLPTSQNLPALATLAFLILGRANPKEGSLAPDADTRQSRRPTTTSRNEGRRRTGSTPGPTRRPPTASGAPSAPTAIPAATGATVAAMVAAASTTTSTLASVRMARKDYRTGDRIAFRTDVLADRPVASADAAPILAGTDPVPVFAPCPSVASSAATTLTPPL